jgi:hypothetical protein
VFFYELFAPAHLTSVYATLLADFAFITRSEALTGFVLCFFFQIGIVRVTITSPSSPNTFALTFLFEHFFGLLRFHVRCAYKEEK